jgi:membrane protease YdiL (CAAX protease family)
MARIATLLRRFFRLAPVRIVAGVAFLFLAVVLRDILLSQFRTAIPIQEPPAVWLGPVGPAPVTWAGALYSLLAAVLTVGLGYGAYRLFTWLLERRTPAELARSRALPELTAGAAIGLGLVSVLVFALWLAGAYRVTAVNGWFFLLAPGAGSATAAFMEELAFRGILFRIVEERWGTWLALGLTAALASGVVARLARGAAREGRGPPILQHVRRGLSHRGARRTDPI